NGQFQDVSKGMGPGITAQHSSRGCAFGDYDNDGDIDTVVNNMNEIPSLLRNDGGNNNNWIKVKLIGTRCNRTAIGARVRVVTGKHSQMDEVHSGTSVMSQSDLRLHFGIGQAKKIDSLEVRWPTTQKIETFIDLDPNQILIIKEGSGIIQKIMPNLKTKGRNGVWGSIVKRSRGVDYATSLKMNRFFVPEYGRDLNLHSKPIHSGDL